MTDELPGAGPDLDAMVGKALGRERDALRTAGLMFKRAYEHRLFHSDVACSACDARFDVALTALAQTTDAGGAE